MQVKVPVPPCISVGRDGLTEVVMEVDDKAGKAALIKISADAVRLQITSNISHDAAKQELLQFLARVSHNPTTSEPPVHPWRVLVVVYGTAQLTTNNCPACLLSSHHNARAVPSCLPPLSGLASAAVGANDSSRGKQQEQGADSRQPITKNGRIWLPVPCTNRICSDTLCAGV
jgi:hypothetical protein